MSFWSIMNWVAWALCALIVFLIVKDVISVEKPNRKNDQPDHSGNQ